MFWITRVLFLLVFALFWGGLTFYTGFVVRVSHSVLGDPMDGGLITQQVTNLLQLLGVVAVFFMALNAMVVKRQSSKFGWSLLGCTLLLSCSLVGLFVVHGHLDSVIDASAYEITNRDAFDTGHRRYNQLTTIQWLASLAYLVITVVAWRSIDATGQAGAKAQ